MITELLEVALDMSRSQGTASTGKERVDTIPSQTGTVETARQSGLIIIIFLEIERWHAGDKPGGRRHHINAVLGIFEVINIGSIVLRTTCLSSQQLCKLTGKRDLRWLGKMQEWYLVKYIGKPLTLLLPIEINTPESILQWLRTHGDLRRKSLFGKMLQGTTHLEVLGEIILPVHTKHGLASLSIIRITFQGYIDRGTRIDDALIENGNLTRIVIYRIVCTLCQGNTTSSYNDRTLWYVIGIQRDDAGRRAFKLTHHQILIFLSYLSGYGLGTVIQFGKGIFLCCIRSHSVLDQIITHITSERFYFRNKHTTIRNGIAFYIVIISVAMRLVVVIKSVSTKHTNDWRILYSLFWNIREINTRSIALIFYVKTEFLLFYIRGEIIHVLHHQVPVTLLRITTGILERLDKKSLLGISNIRSKLTHLISYTTRCIFIGHSQYLIGLNTRLQRYITQGSIDGILRRVQKTGTLQFLKISTSNQTGSLQSSGSLINIPGCHILGSHCLILGIGTVRRHLPGCRPHRITDL